MGVAKCGEIGFGGEVRRKGNIMSTSDVKKKDGFCAILIRKARAAQAFSCDNTGDHVDLFRRICEFESQQGFP